MRPLSTLAKAALSGGHVVMRWIVRANLVSGYWGVSDGPDTFTWDNGVTGPVSFVPFGEALRISIPAVQAAGQVQDATVSISATDPTLLALLAAEDYRAQPFDIALVLFDPATGLAAEEFLKWRGKGNVVEINDDPVKLPSPDAEGSGGGHDDEAPSIATATLTIANQTVDMKRSSGRLATQVDQQLFRDASDTFFQDVALVGVSTINWGQSGVSSPAFSATTQAMNGAPNGLAALLGQLGGGASSSLANARNQL